MGYRGWFPPSQPSKETHRDSASVGLVLSAPFCKVQTSLRESTCSAHVVEVGGRGFQGSPVDNCPFVGGSAPPIRGSVGRPTTTTKIYQAGRQMAWRAPPSRARAGEDTASGAITDTSAWQSPFYPPPPPPPRQSIQGSVPRRSLLAHWTQPPRAS